MGGIGRLSRRGGRLRSSSLIREGGELLPEDFYGKKLTIYREGDAFQGDGGGGSELGIQKELAEKREAEAKKVDIKKKPKENKKEELINKYKKSVITIIIVLLISLIPFFFYAN